MYKVMNDSFIRRLSDGAYIPTDAANASYQEYLKWLAAGNAPDPVDVKDPNDAILEQIAEIELTTMVPRIVRESMLMFAEDMAQRESERLAAEGVLTTKEELLAQNIGYQKTKAVDDQIRALRSQLK